MGIMMGYAGFRSFLDSETMRRAVTSSGADGSSFNHPSSIEWLGLSAVGLAFVDELGHLQVVIMSDGNDLLIDKPLDAFGTVG